VPPREKTTLKYYFKQECAHEPQRSAQLGLGIESIKVRLPEPGGSFRIKPGF